MRKIDPKTGRFMKGSTPWNIGRPSSEDAKAKMSVKRKLAWLNPEYHARMVKSLTGRKMPEGFAVRQAMVLRRPEVRAKQLAAMHSPQMRIKQSVQLKKLWNNETYRQSQTKAIMNSWSRSPNKFELKVLSLIEKSVPNEYKFVGDGQFIVGGICPDFLNVNGQKKIIEAFGRIFHDPTIRGFHNSRGSRTEEQRRKVYSKYGYDMLVVWDYEMKDEIRIENKIKEFNAK